MKKVIDLQAARKAAELDPAMHPTSRLFVSPCGKSAVWIHPLDLQTGHFERYADWTDCTDMDDEAFERFVVGLQQAN